MHPIVEQIGGLPVSEQLAIVQQVCDNLASGNENFFIKAADLQEAERRADECRLNPDLAIDEEEFWRRVNRNV